jgi:uncharacterized membrane protein
MSALVFVLLLVSVPFDPDTSALPFGPFWGLDLHNLWLFHHCSVRNAPYADPKGGVICHDVEQRIMKYPPLLYWSFVWLRAFPFGTAIRLWAVFTIVATLGSLLLWTSGWTAAAAAVLLLAHYPFLFTLERGNSDVLIVLLWTGAMVAWRRQRFTLSGVAAGLAIAAKVYPMFAVGIVFLAATRANERVRFAAGCLAGVGAALFLFFQDSLQYVAILRSFASEHPARLVFGHGLPTYFAPVFAAALMTLLGLAAWAAARHSFSGEDVPLAFAFALIIATFFTRTSYDYNLITAYPLVVVLVARLARTASWPLFAAVAALTLSVAGDRYPFRYSPTLLVLLEVLAIALAGFAVLRMSIAGRNVIARVGAGGVEHQGGVDTNS